MCQLPDGFTASLPGGKTADTVGRPPGHGTMAPPGDRTTVLWVEFVNARVGTAAFGHGRTRPRRLVPEPPDPNRAARRRSRGRRPSRRDLSGLAQRPGSPHTRPSSARRETDKGRERRTSRDMGYSPAMGRACDWRVGGAPGPRWPFRGQSRKPSVPGSTDRASIAPRLAYLDESLWGAMPLLAHPSDAVSVGDPNRIWERDQHRDDGQSVEADARWRRWSLRSLGEGTPDEHHARLPRRDDRSRDPCVARGQGPATQAM